MNTDFAVFAAGCFWGVQFYFKRSLGVVKTEAGYTGGNIENPTYEQVLTGKTGHYEAVMVEFDPNHTDFEKLAKLFFEIHDFTQTDGQGPDIGPQYRSAIFYKDGNQRQIAQKLIKVLEDKGFDVSTQILPFKKFWKAESYHQNYYDIRGGFPYCHIRRKIF